MHYGTGASAIEGTMGRHSSEENMILEVKKETTCLLGRK